MDRGSGKAIKQRAIADQGGFAKVPSKKPNVPEELQPYSSQIKNGKITLYHGTNDVNVKPGELNYGSFLSSVKSGKDVTGNAGASEYGKYVHKVELPIKDVRANSTGEFQYVGKSASLKGTKYPTDFYKKYNDYHGSNLTAKEIERESDVYITAKRIAGYSDEGARKLLGQPPQVGKTPEFEGMLQDAGLAPTRTQGLLAPPKRPTLSPAQAKQQFRKLGRENRPFDVTNPQRAEGLYNVSPEGVVRQGKPSSLPIRGGSAPPKKVRVKALGVEDSSKLRDINPYAKGFKDLTRNFEKVYGKQYPKIKKQLLDPFDAGKGQMVRDEATILKGLEKNVTKLGIKKGSKNSKLIQRFGEKKITLDELKKASPDKWQDIVKADKWFRKQYDQMLDEVNAIRARIYPNQPEKQIPRRKDYYRHFREMEGLEGFKNSFETPSGIDPKLAGISDYTKPKSKFLSFAQRRLGDESKEDAVGGFLDYTRAWAYSKNIDPHIGKFRKLAYDLAEDTAPDPRLNNFTEYLHDFADDLSGKTNPVDRVGQKYLGRGTFRIISNTNSRIKRNTLMGSASSTLAQTFNIPQGIANAGPRNAAKGLVRSFGDIIRGGSREMKQSSFISERYSNSLYNKFDQKLLDQPKKFAGWLLSIGDEIGSKYIWNSHYEKAVAQGIKNPVKYADDWTRKMVAGRGVGEVPIVQKSKIFQVVAPFQIEVQNLIHALGDNVAKKQVGKIVTFSAVMFLMNRGAKELRGSDVGFDPLNALIEAYKTFEEEEDKKTGALKAGGRIAGEFLSNVAGGQTIGAAYPEFGAAGLPSREELFGDRDPTRFGGGILATKGLSDPLHKLIPPFGGAQIKKTREGAQAISRGYTETASGRVRYPVENDPYNLIKTLIMGPNASEGAQKYHDEDLSALGEEQSEQYKALAPENRQTFLDRVLGERKVNKEKDKAKSQSGVSKLSTGKYYAKVGDQFETFDSKQEADLAVAKDKFKRSNKNIQEYGDNVFRRNKDGSVEVKPKLEYDYSLNTNKLQKSKANDDLKGWFDIANKQLDILDKQYQDPTLDDLEKSEIEEKANKLISDMQKYKGYGGFTKPKKGPKGSKGNPKFDWDLFAFAPSPASFSRSLRELVEEARVRGRG